MGVPALVENDVTGKCDGEQLKAARARRPTPQRLERLEEDRDELVRSVANIREDVAEMKGTLKVLPDLVRSVKDAADRLTARDDQTQRTQAKIDEAERIDKIDARQARRKFWLTVACTFVSGGGVSLLLRYLGVL